MMVGLALIGSCIRMTLLLLKARGDLHITEVMLSVFSGLIGQGNNGSTKTALERGCKVVWLLLVCLISICYTNILQSIVVVPSVQQRHLNIWDMMRDNFTFASSRDLLVWLRDTKNWRSHALSLTGNSSSAEKLEMMSLRMVEFQIPTFRSWYDFVQHFSEGLKNVLVVNKPSIAAWKSMPSQVGRNLLLGKEQLFSYPFWWSFVRVERGCLLARSLIIFRQAGFVQYFLKLYDEKVQREWAAAVYRDFAKVESTAGQTSRTDFGVSMADGLVSESFALFVYGISLATAGFVSEFVLRLMVSLVPTLIMLSRSFI